MFSKKRKRGWHDPTSNTNYLTFVLFDKSLIVTLEKGNNLAEILEDLSVKINHQTFYRITYPDASGRTTALPDNNEDTPWLEMLLPDHQVKSVWLQREKRRHG